MPEVTKFRADLAGKPAASPNWAGSAAGNPHAMSGHSRSARTALLHPIFPPEPRAEGADFSRTANSRVGDPHRSALSGVEGPECRRSRNDRFALLRAAATSQEIPTKSPRTLKFPLHFQTTNGKVTKRQEQPDEYQIAHHDA